MSEREIDNDSRQAVLLRPGDLLILGNVGSQIDPTELSDVLTYLKETLELSSVVVFHDDIRLASIGREEIEALMDKRKQAKQ